MVLQPHIPLLLVETIDKTALSNLIFRSDSGFSVLFINFICEIKTADLFIIKCSKTLIRKTLALILHSASRKILQIFWIDCYVVQRIPENLTRKDNFVNFAGLLLWVYVKTLFSIFLNFESFLRQLWLLTSLRKEWYTNKSV